MEKYRRVVLNRRFSNNFLSEHDFVLIAESCHDKPLGNRLYLRVHEYSAVCLVEKSHNPFKDDKMIEMKCLDSEKKLSDFIRLLYTID